MKVWIVETTVYSESYDSFGPETTIYAVVDSEEKARSKIEKMANQMINEYPTDDNAYPKITEDGGDYINVAENCFENEDYVSFYYTDYEVE